MRGGGRGRRAPFIGTGAVGLLLLGAPTVTAGTDSVPNLVVNATASPATATAGTPVTITVTVTNSGGIAAEPALKNTLPDGMVFQRADTDRGKDCAVTGQVVRCLLGSALERAETARVEIVAIPVDTGTLTNLAESDSVTLGVVTHLESTPITVSGEPLRCFGVVPTIFGTDGADELDGTPADDVIVGLGGKDSISAGAGNDKICAGAGDDQIDGGSGSDMLSGDDGNDVVSGGAGADVVHGGGGKDVLICDAKNDVCDGGEGQDTFITVP